MPIPVTISVIEQETPTVKAFSLDLRGQPFGFKPGQWIDCYADIDGKREVAGYSITSSPTVTDSIGIAVKLVGDNPVTTYMHEGAKVGDVLYVEGGQGDFFYEGDTEKPLVLIAGGIGITPLMSIVRYADAASPPIRVTLLYSAATPRELIFRDQLDRIAARRENITIEYTVTQPAEEPWKGRTGRIDTTMLVEARIDLDSLFYVCGPPAMIQDMIVLLSDIGISNAKIRYEQWW